MTELCPDGGEMQLRFCMPRMLFSKLADLDNPYPSKGLSKLQLVDPDQEPGTP